MNMWAQIAGGVVVALAVVDASPGGDWAAASDGATVGARYSDGTFTVVSPVISSTDFMARFTPGELAAMAGNPSTLVMMVAAAASGTINLTNPVVVADVNAVVALGYIAADRVAVILALESLP